ncbi:MAG: glycosyltransferase [Lachnospiraceae bacterium]|nr:glycosyltransferase [Lachnospiraceae bacterium]
MKKILNNIESKKSIKPLFSVIMPTFNRGYIIERAIKSVLNQTYDNLELIIVDDGSNDNTQDIVLKFNDQRIKYIKLDGNYGANKARNVGMDNARGEYLSFLDSDNAWLTNYLEERCKGFENDTDIVFGRVKINTDNGEYVVPDNKIIYNDNILELKKYMSSGNLMDTNATCIRYKCFNECGGFDERLGRFQDWEFFLRLIFIYKKNVYFQNNTLINNFIYKDSISKKFDLIDDSLCIIYDKYLNYFIKENCLDNYIVAVINLSKNVNGIVKIKEKILDYINKCCLNKGIKRIALYGYGYRGRAFCDFFKQSDVEVSAIIDRKIIDSKFTPKIYNSAVDLPYCDVIIVTVENDFLSIKEILNMETEIEVQDVSWLLN